MSPEVFATTLENFGKEKRLFEVVRVLRHAGAARTVHGSTLPRLTLPEGQKNALLTASKNMVADVHEVNPEWFQMCPPVSGHRSPPWLMRQVRVVEGALCCEPPWCWQPNQRCMVLYVYIHTYRYRYRYIYLLSSRPATSREV